MQVLVTGDNHIHGSAERSREVEAEVAATLERFAEQITRVEVHLHDANGHKGGDDDKRCTMEARLGGLQPIVVTHDAGTLDEAIDGAVEKLERTLDRTIDKLSDVKGRTSYGGDQVI